MCLVRHASARCGCIVMLQRKLETLYDPLRRPIEFLKANIVFYCLIYVCISCTQNILLYHLLQLCYLFVCCVAFVIYTTHESASPRDPAAQTADGVIHTADPSFWSSSGLTPHGVATAWAQYI